MTTLQNDKQTLHKNQNFYAHFCKMDLINTWKARRDEAKSTHKKFLTSLKKNKNKSLNAIADELHEQLFQEIDCLDCANCCISIPPIVNETDVKRAAKFLGMKAADFKAQYVRIDEDQDMVMKSSPCPFLEADNKCFIYEARPKACREYPHTNNHEFLKHLKLHAINSYYCPAVFHILERMK
jgi:Fe-S-cluster containining protein